MSRPPRIFAPSGAPYLQRLDIGPTPQAPT